MPSKTFSQGISNLWMMGYESFSSNPKFGGTNINFYTGFPDTSHVNRSMNFSDCNANISDSAGNLLFYTNGIYIANANNDSMVNGDSLNFYTYHSSGDYGLRIRQGNLILPFPEHPNLYYLFHETYYVLPSSVHTVLNIYYSIIDMTLDGGLGAVTQKNQLLLADTLTVGGITACKHANGRDWWVVFHKKSGSTYYKFLLSPSGTQGPFSQNIGLSFPYTNDFIWQSCFSPDGNKFASVTYRDTLDIMNFDRCTGIFSNSISINLNDSSIGRGVAFAPNSRYLYVSSGKYLYQFDTDSSNILASKTTIGRYDGFTDQGLPFATFFYQAQLATDGKIYINTPNTTQWLHVINHPDNPGLNCDLVQHGLMLPTYNGFTIPNFPNYFLGVESNSICDSLHLGIHFETTEQIQIYPNPCSNTIKISGITNAIDLQVINHLGQILITKNFNYTSNFINLNVSELNCGFYHLRIRTNSSIYCVRFLKIE